MFKDMPPIIKKASYALLIGILMLGLSLFVSGPIPYILTMSIGGAGLGLALLLYLIVFFRK